LSQSWRVVFSRFPPVAVLGNVLQDFMKLLQDVQFLSYGANGTTTAFGSTGSTLVNSQA
jgi:hypothetical protein